MPVAGGEVIELSEIGPEAEHSPEKPRHVSLGVFRDAVAAQSYPETRALRCSKLRDGCLERLIIDHQNTPPTAPIPSIHRIMRSPAQCPSGEIKTKRRNRTQLETQ